MLAEPQTLTISTVAKTLSRVSMGDRTGTFENTAAGLRLRVTHFLGKRIRRVVRVDFTKTAADPLLDGVSRQYSMSAYLTVDQPVLGFASTDIEANVKALVDYLAVPANLAKVVNGES